MWSAASCMLRTPVPHALDLLPSQVARAVRDLEPVQATAAALRLLLNGQHATDTRQYISLGAPT